MFDRRQVLAGGVALAAASGAPNVFAQAGGGAMLPIDFSPSGAMRAWRMHPRVFIASYPIRFIMAAEANAGGRVGIFLTLVGPTEADMRSLAEEGRADLAARIVASTGKQVVEPAELLAEPGYRQMPKVPGNAKWDSGVLDPMGKRFWYLVAPDSAPLIEGLGSSTGAPEMSINSRMTGPSRALDAVALLPSMTLEFSTLSGSVRSGSAGSTAWAGGDILFGYKPHSWTFFMAGGKRSIEMVGGSFYPKGRVLITPTQIPGRLVNNAGNLPADMAARLGRGRYDTFVADMPGWRELVRSAYRGYNESLVRKIVAAIG